MTFGTEVNQLSIFDSKTSPNTPLSFVVQATTLHEALFTLKTTSLFAWESIAITCVLPEERANTGRIILTALKPTKASADRADLPRRILTAALNNLASGYAIKDALEKIAMFLPFSHDESFKFAHITASLPWNISCLKAVESLNEIKAWQAIGPQITSLIEAVKQQDQDAAVENALENVSKYLSLPKFEQIDQNDFSVTTIAKIGSIKEIETQRLMLVLLNDDLEASLRTIKNIQSLCPKNKVIFIDALVKSDGDLREQLSPNNILSLKLSPISSSTKETLVESSDESFATVGDVSSISVSALSQFALCPYRYFAQYHLNLRPVEGAGFWSLSPAKVGEFLHAVLEHELPAILQGKSVEEVDFKHYRDQYFDVKNLSVFHQVDLEKVERSITTILENEKQRLGEGRALMQQEAAFNFPFSTTNDSGHRVTLKGRIDRIDKLSDGRLIVVDYKSTSKPIGPKVRQQILELIRPQLAIYALAVDRLRLGTPAGVVEYRVGARKEGGVIDRSLKALYKSASYEKVELRDFIAESEAKLSDFVTSLQHDPLKPLPTDSEQCGLSKCRFYSLCRFDLKVEEGL